MTKFSLSTRSIATLLVLAASTMTTTNACSCWKLPTTESSFEDPDLTILQVMVREEIAPEDPDAFFYTRRFDAYIQDVFKGDSCRTMTRLYWKTMEITTANQGSMCGVSLKPNTSYVFAARLQSSGVRNNDLKMDIGSCDYYREWDSLSRADQDEFRHFRDCRCAPNACGGPSTTAPYLCPDGETMAGASDVCRYNIDNDVCTWNVECPVCQEDWDCGYGQYCADNGLCTMEEN